MLCDEKIGHFGLAQPEADTIAGDPRLGDLEFGGSDSVSIADAVLFAMTNTFMTGMTLKVDGGESLT